MQSHLGYLLHVGEFGAAIAEKGRTMRQEMSIRAPAWKQSGHPIDDGPVHSSNVSLYSLQPDQTPNLHIF